MCTFYQLTLLNHFHLDYWLPLMSFAVVVRSLLKLALDLTLYYIYPLPLPFIIYNWKHCAIKYWICLGFAHFPVSKSRFKKKCNLFQFRYTVASFIKEVNWRLAKRPLKTNGRLANRQLTSLVKEATVRRSSSMQYERSPGNRDNKLEPHVSWSPQNPVTLATSEWLCNETVD